MPNYDKTGPAGAGPLTGRGLGRCGAPDDAGPRNGGYGVGRGGRPWGGGRGRCHGGGRGGGQGRGWGGSAGRGRGAGWGRAGGWGRDGGWADDERAMLEQRKRALEAELAATEQELSSMAVERPDDEPSA